jgi:hypothetical protein
MKKTFLFTLFGLFTSIVTAQIVTDELPYGLKEDSIGVKQQDIIVLSAPDITLVSKEDSINDSKPGAIRYAFPTYRRDIEFCSSSHRRLHFQNNSKQQYFGRTQYRMVIRYK